MKDKLLSMLADIWSEAGSARDNDEPMSFDWLQETALKCRDIAEKLEEPKA